MTAWCADSSSHGIPHQDQRFPWVGPHTHPAFPLSSPDEKPRPGPHCARRPPFRALLFAALALALVAAGVAWVRAGVPDVAALASANPAQSRYMQLRAAQPGRADGTYRMGAVPLEGFSPLLVCAVVKSEDRRFFRHHGIDWPQVRRAARRNLAGHRAGASTITQQTARNLYLGPERSLRRKAREIAIARAMEDRLDKRRILELYLNGAEWGDGVWGAGAGARHHLGRDAGEVDAFGAALLAAMLPAPRSPLTGLNRQRAERVQRRVLNQLLDSELLTRGEWLDAQVRTDTLHARLRRGLPLADALPRPSDGRSPARFIPPPTARGVTAAVAGECGLARELGER